MSSDAEDTLFEAGGAYSAIATSEVNSVTAVIPAYNERDTIGQIVRSAMQYASEVIVVDDGSEDNTGELAISAGATVIRIPKNTGKGHALGIGLSTAAMNGCNVVVCLDADGQHDPADIPRIVQPIVDGMADMVIGSRFLNQESKNLIPTYRKVGQSILTSATNFKSPVKITDSQSGYRAFSKNIVSTFTYSEAGMGIESEMVRNAVRYGARIREVPISAKYDGSKTSTYRPASHGMRVIGSIIRSVGSEHPLMYFGATGVIVFLTGLLAGLYTILHQIETSTALLVPAVISVTMIALGILFMLVALILNAIGIVNRNTGIHFIDYGRKLG